MSTIHIIGAGLAGLSAAVQLARSGAQIVIHEGANQAGGRARSFYDRHLDRVIDNGNHLMLSGNYSVLNFLNLIRAETRLAGPGQAKFDFADLETGDFWSIDFNRGPVPLWVLYQNRRVPGTSMLDYLSGLKLLTAGDRSIASLFGDQGQMYRRFWEPFSVAVLNTAPDVAVARLLLPVIRETLAKGADYSKPLVAKVGLSDTFVDPALKWLSYRKVDVRMGRRISAVEDDGKRVTAIRTGKSKEVLGADDKVVMAVPANIAPTLVSGICAPDRFAPIVNAHFLVEGLDDTKLKSKMIGLVASPAHWLFVRDDIISVTVSAGHDLAGKPAADIAATIWPDIAKICGLDGREIPPVRIIKEHRATFQVTAEQLAKRPKTTTHLNNLVLAGDWTDTGLPATIEGAIRSGVSAAREIIK